jgi:hypothetical protein
VEKLACGDVLVIEVFEPEMSVTVFTKVIFHVVLFNGSTL